MNNRTKSRGPGPVPERWLHCPRKSVALVDNKFLIFKTPLSHDFDNQVPEESRFHVNFVFMSMKSYKVKVGLWIDLTYTSRFYDKKEVEGNDCRYVKLQCRGHGETPSEDQTKAFINICDSFIKQNPLEVIGVHCTHGFNRSGFLVIAYLIEVLDWGLEAAMAEFARVRPPGIYKKDYIDELYRRYDDIQFAPEPPELPDWCLEFDDSVTDDPHDGESMNTSNGKRRASQEEESTSNGDKKRKREFVKKNPVFMEGVKGVEVVKEPLLGKIQRKVQSLCKWNNTGFPGCQPVSMDVSNMKLLQEKPYRVSWKADGTRYLMYIQDRDEIFCIDRDNCVFQVKGLSFPYRKDLKSHLKGTLLDGEMVIDKVGGKSVPRYLVYDIITICDGAVRNEPFIPTRFNAIKCEIITPRHQAIEKGMINKLKEPFSVRLKEFFDIGESAKLLGEKFCKTLSHEPDGLIFQPSREPYISGRCDDVLKWKPASHNSVDFKLKIVVEEGYGIVRRKIGRLFAGGMDHPFAVLTPINKTLAALDNKIIECTYQNNRWVFMRERTDKSFPNGYETAKAVCNSIMNPVTKEMLLDFIDKHRYIDLMPPPPTFGRHH